MRAICSLFPGSIMAMHLAVNQGYIGSSPIWGDMILFDENQFIVKLYSVMEDEYDLIDEFSVYKNSYRKIFSFKRKSDGEIVKVFIMQLNAKIRKLKICPSRKLNIIESSDLFCPSIPYKLMFDGEYKSIDTEIDFAYAFITVNSLPQDVIFDGDLKSICREFVIDLKEAYSKVNKNINKIKGSTENSYIGTSLIGLQKYEVKSFKELNQKVNNILCKHNRNI